MKEKRNFKICLNERIFRLCFKNRQFPVLAALKYYCADCLPLYFCIWKSTNKNYDPASFANPDKHIQAHMYIFIHTHKNLSFCFFFLCWNCKIYCHFVVCEMSHCKWYKNVHSNIFIVVLVAVFCWGFLKIFKYHKLW